MGNCNACVRGHAKAERNSNRTNRKKKKKRTVDRKPNPYAEDSIRSPAPIRVLKDIVPFTHRTRIGDKYILGRELGRGEFGITYLCTDRETKEALACKSISKRKLRTGVDVEDVRREVAIMSTLPDHPNVVKLKATYEDNENVHLVMELCEGGELFDRIVARGHYSERAAASVARTIAEVVRMCHANGVMHRDLKPENFLFANKKEHSPLKAIDFGLSVFFKPGERFSEIVGSPYYMAPEVLKRNYGPEVDVWSSGVILYILLCGVPPFWAETEQGVALAILRGVIDFKREPWPQISDCAKGLVRQMLEPDPRKRLTAQQVLDHSWLQNAKKASNVPLGDIVRSRLKQFSVMNRFKKKALRVIAEHLSVEEVEVIRDMFTLMDTDRDGKVTYEELRTGLRKVGSQLAEPEIKMLMEVVHHEKFFCTEYEKSKALADKVAIQAASGLPIVAVYPGVIYGPGKVTAGNVVARMLVERFNGRLPGYIGSGNDKFSFSHVDDVVDGHIGAMNKGRPGERYLLTGENASFRHVFDLSAIITETRKPLFNIPYWVIEGYGWVSVLFSRITGQLPLISPPTVRVLRHQWAYSCEKAKLDLDYNPRGLKEGLAEMLHWLKNLGLIKF